MVTIPHDDPRAVAVRAAIQSGDVDSLTEQLAAEPELAAAWLGSPPGCPPDEARSLLHVVTDWPGHVPHGPAMVAVLVAAGSDVNAWFVGSHTETPLHWAASSDDVAVLDALLDAGADIEARGAVIAGGTALADATAFGQWAAARRLVERGAQANLWEAATMGLVDRVEAHLASEPAPTPEEITGAFWGACHGGQLATAQLLLARGADINWRSDWDGLTPLQAAERSEAPRTVTWLEQQGAQRKGS